MADIPGSDDRYLAVFNLSDQDKQFDIPFSNLELAGAVTFRELWSGEEKIMENQLLVELEPYALASYKLIRGGKVKHGPGFILSGQGAIFRLTSGYSPGCAE